MNHQVDDKIIYIGITAKRVDIRRGTGEGSGFRQHEFTQEMALNRHSKVEGPKIFFLYH